MRKTVTVQIPKEKPILTKSEQASIRLVKIYKLLEKKPMSHPQLMKMLGVSPRTLFNDLAILKQQGKVRFDICPCCKGSSKFYSAKK